eukprot:scaffold59109_cov67-Phaeocystis_antarctica.AAC.3
MRGLAKAPHHEAAPFDAELDNVTALRLLRYLHLDLLAVRGGRLNSAARPGLQADNDLVEGRAHEPWMLETACSRRTTRNSVVVSRSKCCSHFCNCDFEEETSERFSFQRDAVLQLHM